MSQQLQDVNLPRNTFDVVCIDDSILFENLDRDLLACQNMCTKLHFTESTRSDRLFQNIITDGFLLVIGTRAHESREK